MGSRLLTASHYCLNASERTWNIWTSIQSISIALKTNLNRCFCQERLWCWDFRGFCELPGLSCMNSGAFPFIERLLPEPLGFVKWFPPREGEGAYRTPSNHLCAAQASQLGQCHRAAFGLVRPVPPRCGRAPLSKCPASANALQLRGIDLQDLILACHCE